MATDVLMPKLSDTMEEGKILKWHKHPGDVVKQGDILAEVETDKANMDIESFDEGVVAELRVGEGESAPVGAVIAVLGAAGEAAKPQAPKLEVARVAPSAPRPVAAAPKAAPAPSKPAPTPAPAPPKAAATRPAAVADRVKASPLAKKVAAERGVDLARVAGSGPGGRILREDIEAAGGGQTAAAPAAAAPTARPATAAQAGTRVELSRTRKTTAKRMAESKRDVPHFYASADIDMDEAVRLREGLVALGAEFEGLTVTHILVKACGVALARVPEMNASLDGDGVVRHAQANVGIATATDEGLLVPVVHGCDAAPLAAVAQEARAVVERARAGKPAGEDLSGATFTVSNLGMFPVSHFAAVINPPQAAILAVGTIREVPVVRAGAVVPGRLMTVTLSCDHRVVDGALAGRFLRELKALLEQPLALVV
ncbi:MAG TPA: dihydrolipoamide acetyltransferase family protein [Candidatus Eisenbacteria bacterium]|nr:dihydrolipoamide acetyltransferase family protein [Candidatus Eisenbacteria bacterium]